VTNTKSSSVFFRSRSDFRYSSIPTRVAAPLEHPSLEVDDVDVDVLAKRHYSSARVDRILVLVYKDSIVQPVRTLLVPAKVVHVQEIGLA
jgi:hypothetical protein